MIDRPGYGTGARRAARLAAALIAAGSLWAAGTARAEEGWGALDSLVGAWTGEGQGQPGTGSGDFTFQRELSGKVLVRRSQADYPAAQGRPAVHHEDLIVVYQDQAGAFPRAVYFDSEGHVIRYAVRASAAGDTLEFLSEPDSAAPAYRLRYVRTGPGLMRITFDIAPPGKPGEFRQYLQGACRRR